MEGHTTGTPDNSAREGEQHDGTIIGAIIGGLIIGALARMVMPGHQNISVVMTIVLGILGSAIGSWLVYQLGYSNSNGGFEWIPFFAGIAIAAILIAVYMSVTGRRSITR